MSEDVEYLGNSVSVEQYDEQIVLSSEKSDGYISYVRMDRLVLRKFLDWLEDNYADELEAALDRWMKR